MGSLGVVDLMTVSEDSNSPSKVSSSSAAMTEEDNNVEEGCYEAMKRKFTKSDGVSEIGSQFDGSSNSSNMKSTPLTPGGQAQYKNPSRSMTSVRIKYQPMAEFFKTHHNHQEILSYLQGTHLGSKCDNGHTVLYNIMTDVTNGDKIVDQMLNQCVTTSQTDENHPDYALVIDLDKLRGHGASLAGSNNSASIKSNESSSKKASTVLKDLLRFKDEPAANKLLCHPVVTTIIDIRWFKLRHFFLLNFLVYAAFLVTYCMYLGNIFYRLKTQKIVTVCDDGDSHCVTFKFEIPPSPHQSNNKLPGGDTNRVPNDEFFTSGFEKRQAGSSHNPLGTLCKSFADFDENSLRIREETRGGKKKNDTWLIKPAFRSCRRRNFVGTCIIEVTLASLLILLFTQELAQVVAIGGRHYFSELENWIELAVITLGSLSLGTQHLEDTVKWISAFGIVLAHIEMIFLLGRYPPLGGRISIMFYNITRHLLKSISNLIILTFGFAFGFFIMHHRTDSHSFQNPAAAVVKTLTLVLGEYELGGFLETDFPDEYSRAFSVALLVILAIIGSLVMVNLFVAIIVSDIEDLRAKGLMQESVIKAQHIVHCESLASAFTGTWCGLKNAVGMTSGGSHTNRIEICPHSMCRCRKTVIEQNVVDKLKEILKQRSD